MAMPPQKPGQSRQDYGTPQDFLLAIKARLSIDEFAFDFAADGANAKAPLFWTEEIDALAQNTQTWRKAVGRGWGWLNPPFANIHDWVWRCLDVAQKGGKITFLVPASVGSNWYRDFIHEQHGVQTLFLNGRLCFIEDWQHTINPKTGKFYTSEPLYPKDCICVLFGTGSPYNADVWTWK